MTIQYLDGRYKFPKGLENPFTKGYVPELDRNSDLEPKAASYFQLLIGILRWIMELGHVDIIIKVLMKSFFLELSRMGHLKAAL